MSKRTSKIEPIDIDELFRSPSLDGMLSFREVDPGAPTGPTPIGATPAPAAPLRPTPTPLGPAGETPAGVSHADILGELKRTVRAAPSRGKLMRAHQVEDAHSNNEHGLYSYLWQSGQAIRNSESRFVQAGYAQLSRGIGLDRSNVQMLLRSLEAKAAIRVVTPGTVKSATVYEVFSGEQILARRRESGLLWVRRYGSRRVDFVNEAGEILTPIGATPVAAARSGGQGGE